MNIGIPAGFVEVSKDVFEDALDYIGFAYWKRTSYNDVVVYETMATLVRFGATDNDRYYLHPELVDAMVVEKIG